MTREDVIAMAREAGFEVHPRKEEVRIGVDAMMGLDTTPKLERFAALVAAAEREACAQQAEFLSRLFPRASWEISAAIRSRATVRKESK
jgi:hypothetical protein